MNVRVFSHDLDGIGRVVHGNGQIAREQLVTSAVGSEVGDRRF